TSMDPLPGRSIQDRSSDGWTSGEFEGDTICKVIRRNPGCLSSGAELRASRLGISPLPLGGAIEPIVHDPSGAGRHLSNSPPVRSITRPSPSDTDGAGPGTATRTWSGGSWITTFAKHVARMP